MSNLLVTIIIPCRNVEDYVGRAIDSAIAQTYRPIEIVLVDNDSNDETWDILAEYQKCQPDLITCFREFKQGAPVARNKGLYEARGDWIQFLDADDQLFPTKIENQLELIAKSKEKVSLVVGSSVYRGFANKDKIRISNEIDPWLGLMKGTLGNTCSNLWSKEAVERAGGWNEEQQSSQEYELMFRILRQAGEVLFDKQPQCIIQRRAKSISTSDVPGNRHRAATLHLKIFEYLLENKPEAVKQHPYDFYHSVLKHISVLGIFEPGIASSYHKAWIPNDFRINDRDFGRFYRIIYNLSGFNIAQFLYRPYSRLRRWLIPQI